MYIWMVLASFIVMLYTFSLSHRADMREIIVSPRAEAVAARIIQKHKAAVKYMYDYSPPTNGQKLVTYTEGRIRPDDLTVYLPYGFNDDGSFESFIYCIRQDSVNGGFNAGAASCDAPDTIKFLATYGCVPPKWRAVSTGWPSGDLLAAMRKTMDFGNNFGIAAELESGEHNDIGSDMSVVGKEGTGMSIPQYIIDGNFGSESFSSMCGSSRDENACPYCLMYLTPFN